MKYSDFYDLFSPFSNIPVNTIKKFEISNTILHYNFSLRNKFSTDNTFSNTNSIKSPKVILISQKKGINRSLISQGRASFDDSTSLELLETDFFGLYSVITTVTPLTVTWWTIGRILEKFYLDSCRLVDKWYEYGLECVELGVAFY